MSVKQINGALSQLRSAAQKAAPEEIKKVAATIVENQKGIRLANAKVATVVAEHEKNIATANEKAAAIVAEFEADWGTWDSKPEAV